MECRTKNVKQTFEITNDNFDKIIYKDLLKPQSQNSEKPHTKNDKI